jgi:hypothetical protein
MFMCLSNITCKPIKLSTLFPSIILQNIQFIFRPFQILPTVRCAPDTFWRIPSSGMWYHVDLMWTYVSEESIASIFRVETSASEEPAWASGCRLQTGVVQWLRLTLSKGSNWVGVFTPHLRQETDSVSETSCFLFSRIPGDEKKSSNQ